MCSCATGFYAAALPSGRDQAEGEEQMKFPLRKDIPWRPEDDALLRELARAGEQVAKIAKRLNRSEGSTRNRALRLNITLARARKLKDLTGK
jgi:hypothetical protein